GGQVNIMFADVAALLPHIKSGKLKALGIASAKRFEGLPDVPTIAESGVPGFEAGGFLGLVAPAGAPAAVIEALNAAGQKSLAMAEVRERLNALASPPVGGAPATSSRNSGPGCDVKKAKQGALGRALRTFGVRHLRPGQREVIDNILAGRDTLAIMPSGAGKSLCYQAPALCLEGATLVISPLISLMKDQADKALEREEARLVAEIQAGKAQLIYTTPERLSRHDFVELLRRRKIALAVVDEAHCISHWGHDFRPAYLEIAASLHRLGKPTILALTATATAEVVDDIRRHLERPAMRLVNTGMYRPNLRYAVQQVTNSEEHRAALLACLRRARGSAI